MNKPRTENTLRLKDGRLLGYAEYGDPAGLPVIGFHGMPGSRLFMKVMEEAALNAGARIIAPDRPGYGLSEPRKSGTLMNYLDDIVELADALALDRFGVMGVSGGGPYPLAFSYKHPRRVSVAALISGIGPLRLPNSTRGMVSINKYMFRLGHLSPGLTGWLLAQLIRASLPSMEKHERNGTSPTGDLSPEVFAVLASDQRESIRTGSRGLSFDMGILWQPWGFEFKNIRTRVYLWHGDADNLAPAMLAHHIADHVPGCEAVFYPGEGHTDPFTKHIADIMARIVEAGQPAR